MFIEKWKASPEQQSIWVDYKTFPGKAHYNVIFAAKVTPCLSPPVLKKALTQLAFKHPILTSVFFESDESLFQIHQDPALVNLSIISLERIIEGNVNTFLEDLLCLKFDLEKDFPYKFFLINTTGEQYLAYVAHHIAYDSYSYEILPRDLLEIYSQIEKENAEVESIPFLQSFPVIQTCEDNSNFCEALPKSVELSVRSHAAKENISFFEVCFTSFQMLLKAHFNHQPSLSGFSISTRDPQKDQEYLGFKVRTSFVQCPIDLSLQVSNTFTSIREKIRQIKNSRFSNKPLTDPSSYSTIPLRSLVNYVVPAFNVNIAAFYCGIPNKILSYSGYTLTSTNVGRIPVGPINIGLSIAKTDEETLLSLSLSKELTEILPKDFLQTYIDLLTNIPSCYDKSTLSLIKTISKKHSQEAIIRGPSKPDNLDLIPLIEKMRQVSNLPYEVAELVDKLSPKRVILFTKKNSLYPGIITFMLMKGIAFIPIDISTPELRVQQIIEATNPELVLYTEENFSPSSLKLERPPFFHKLNPCSFSKSLIDLSIDRSISENDLAYILFTSGSTGTPKGVPIRRKSLANFLNEFNQIVPSDISGEYLSSSSISFDVCYLELFIPMIRGKKPIVIDSNDTKNFQHVIEILQNINLGFFQATPSFLSGLIESGWNGCSEAVYASVGEELPYSFAQKIYPKFREVWNFFGPTECTIFTSAHKFSPQDTIVSIGTPIANTSYHILDENLLPLPIGNIGHLYISGECLTEGYLDLPEANSVKFIKNETGEIIYQVGDLVRRRKDGYIEYLGRTDFQIKINGYRIELGDIEENIRSIKGIKNALVMPRTFQEEQKLIAYVIGKISKQDIASHLKTCLPPYMVPSAFVMLDRFPLNKSGKLDRNSLPEPTQKDLLTDKKTILPKNETEEILCSTWERILNLKNISTYANFFEIGGSSLKVPRVIGEIKKQLFVSISFREFYETPTISALAEIVERKNKITEYNIDNDFDTPKNQLSMLSLQESIWLLEKTGSPGKAYSMPFKMDFDKNSNPQKIAALIKECLHRNPIFFCTCDETSPSFHIGKSYDIPIDIIEEEKISSKELESQVINYTFDLNNGPLFKVILLKNFNGSLTAFFNFHHIIMDGYSIRLFAQQIKDTLSGKIFPKVSSEENLSKAQRKTPISEKEKEIIHEEWRQHLSSIDYKLEIPYDLKSSTDNYTGEIIHRSLPRNLVSSINKSIPPEKALDRSALFCTLFGILLSKLSYQDAFCIGAPYHGRNGYIEEHNLLGCFAYPCPIPFRLDSSATLESLQNSVRKDILKSIDLSERTSISEIASALGISRCENLDPLYQVMIDYNFQKDSDPIEFFERGYAHQDLSLIIDDSSSNVSIGFEYKTDKFKRSTIENFIDYYIHLIDQAIESKNLKISNLKLLNENQQLSLLEKSHGKDLRKSEYTHLQDALMSSFEKNKTKKALTFNGITYSYEDLKRYSLSISQKLLKLGKPGDRVLIAMDRSEDAIISILGTILSGMSYIPIGTHFPKSRIQSIISQANPICAISQEECKDFNGIVNILYSRSYERSDIELPCISYEDECYTIFTSGSTGEPKGVPICHKDVLNRIQAKDDLYTISSIDSVLHSYSLIFDGSVLNLFWTLFKGAHLVLTSEQESYDTEAIIELIAKYQITNADFLASNLSNLVLDDNFGDLSTLRDVFSGGSALHQSIVDAFYKKLPQAKLYNTYGPTEATVECAYWETSQSASEQVVPIGHPLPGTKLYVLDKDLNLVPDNVKGELYISGKAISKGYLNNPNMTHLSFLPSPFSKDEIIYKTGDIVKRDHKGILHFVGRKDSQVKLNGFRIELGEITSQLSALDYIKQSYAYIIDNSIIALVQISSMVDEEIVLDAAKFSLSKSLPRYMIPEKIISISEVPTLPNGKPDLKAIKELASIHQDLSLPAEKQNLTDTESKLLTIWKSYLKKESISIYDSFFEIGGHSLLAARMMIAIRKEFNREIHLRDLIQHPTIASLSQFIDQVPSKDSSSIVLLSRTENAPNIFCVHPVGGHVICYKKLAESLGNSYSFYGIQAKGSEGNDEPLTCIRDMAKQYIQDIKSIQNKGPFYISGWSFGGIVAYEITHQLRASGHEAFLVMIDASPIAVRNYDLTTDNESDLVAILSEMLGAHLPKNYKPENSRSLLGLLLDHESHNLDDILEEEYINRLIKLGKANYKALSTYQIPECQDWVYVIQAQKTHELYKTPNLGWDQHTRYVRSYIVPGDHKTIMEDEGVIQLSKALKNAFLQFKVLNGKKNIFSTPYLNLHGNKQSLLRKFKKASLILKED